MALSSPADPRWYDGFFEHEWLDYLALPPPDATRKQVEFILDKLDLEPGARVLDLACGRGRIAIELASRGLQVTGLDLSSRSLELAAEAAEAAGVSLSLAQRDMREVDEKATFHAALNVFTSFGYFEHEEDDRRVLANVARALVLGGLFLLDTINPLVIAAEFVPHERREFEDGAVLVEDRLYDHVSGRHETVWNFRRPDGTDTVFRTSFRAYTAAELVQMLVAAGFAVEEARGGFDDRPLGEGTRTILLARRIAD